jgi:hypothetical protein
LAPPLIAPIDITNKEDGEISITDMNLILHSPPFSPAAPAQIQIKIEHLSDAHNAHKIQSRQDTTEQISNPTSSIPRSTPSTEQVASEINQDFRQLYQNLLTVFELQQGNPVNAWEYELEDD